MVHRTPHAGPTCQRPGRWEWVGTHKNCEVESVSAKNIIFFSPRVPLPADRKHPPRPVMHPGLAWLPTSSFLSQLPSLRRRIPRIAPVPCLPPACSPTCPRPSRPYGCCSPEKSSQPYHTGDEHLDEKRINWKHTIVIFKS